METFTYYEIDDYKFQLERVCDTFYKVTKLYKDRLCGTLHYEGENAYVRVLEFIMSHAEISEEAYNEE